MPAVLLPQGPSLNPPTTSRDPCVFADSDGEQYIIFGVFEYYIARLSTDMIALAEEPRHIDVRNALGPYGYDCVGFSWLAYGVSRGHWPRTACFAEPHALDGTLAATWCVPHVVQTRRTIKRLYIATMGGITSRGVRRRGRICGGKSCNRVS